MTERERWWWRCDIGELQFRSVLDRYTDEYNRMSLMEQARVDFERRIMMEQRKAEIPGWIRDMVSKTFAEMRDDN